MRLFVALSLGASAGLLVSGCLEPYGTDPKSGIEKDNDSTEPSNKKKTKKTDVGKGAAEDGFKPRYGGWLGSTAMVPFGNKPRTTCNWTVTMTSIVAEVDMSETGEVTDMRVKNTMVEGLVDECTAEPLGARPYSFSMMSAMRVSDGIRVELAGAASNSPKASLSVLLRPAGDDLEAVLQWVRTDLGPPYQWEVSAKMTLQPQVPETKCTPGADYCGGKDVLGSPVILYRCDEGGKTLSFLQRCTHECVDEEGPRCR